MSLLAVDPKSSSPNGPRPQIQLTILSKLADLPPFSPVLNKILASIGDENFSYRNMSLLIEQDTALTGNVLRMVNSAAYGGHAEVMAISKAISILGMNKLRNLVLTLSVANMWRSVKVTGEWSLERFNTHELATAILCDAIAERSEVESAEGAFLSGLLHDLGKLLIVMAAPGHAVEIAAHVVQSGCSLVEAEQRVLQTDHAKLAAEALEQWKLPESLRVAVCDHHAPVAGQLSMIVSVADDCANRLGLGVAEPPEPPKGTDVELCLPALARLSLEKKAEVILEDFRTEYQTAKSIAG